MSIQNQTDSAFEQMTFVIANVRSVKSKTLFAFIDVEMSIAGVVFWVKGLQARRVATGGTSIHLPTYKDGNGVWRPAMELPEELRAPLFKAALEALLEEGLAHDRYAVT